MWMASVAAAQQGALKAIEDRKETPQGHEGVGGVSIGAWHWEDAMGTGRKI